MAWSAAQEEVLIKSALVKAKHFFLLACLVITMASPVWADETFDTYASTLLSSIEAAGDNTSAILSALAAYDNTTSGVQIASDRFDSDFNLDRGTSTSTLGGLIWTMFYEGETDEAMTALSAFTTYVSSLMDSSDMSTSEKTSALNNAYTTIFNAYASTVGTSSDSGGYTSLMTNVTNQGRKLLCSYNTVMKNIASSADGDLSSTYQDALTSYENLASTAITDNAVDCNYGSIALSDLTDFINGVQSTSDDLSAANVSNATVMSDMTVNDQANMDLSWNAQSLFTPSGSDISITLLGILFGPVGSALSGVENISGAIFRLFNIGLMAVAGAFISYTVVSNVVRTAQDAGASGRKFSFKLVIRTIAGLTLLTPGITGYSMVQVLVMSAIVYGVGLADVVWRQALHYLENSGGVAYSVPTSTGYDSIGSLLTGNTTLTGYTMPSVDAVANTGDVLMSAYALKAMEFYYQKEQANTDSSISSDDTDPMYGVRYGAACFGDSTPENTYDYRVVCLGSTSEPMLAGAYYWGQSLGSDDADASGLMVVSAYVNQVLSFAEQQIQTMYTQVLAGESSDGTSIACSSSSSGVSYTQCPQASSLLSITSEFYQSMSALELTSNTDAYAWTTEAKQSGWASAGNYYYQLIGQTSSTTNPLMSYGSSSSLANHRLYVSSNYTPFSELNASQYIDTEGVTAVNNLQDALPSWLNQAYSLLQAQSQASGQSSDTSSDTSYQSYVTKDLMGQMVNLIVGVFAHDCDSDSCTFNIGNGLNLSNKDSREMMSAVFYTDYEIGVAQNNVVVMLADAIGGFFGLQILPAVTDDQSMIDLYDDGLSQTYSWWNLSTACTNALVTCNPTWAIGLSTTASNEACYQAAVDNGCIIPGVGILGSYSLFHEGVASGASFVFLDALGVVNRIGKTLIRAGINYFRTTITGTLAKAWVMVGLTQKQVYATSVAGGASAGAALLIPDFGGAVSAGISAMSNLFNALASFTYQWDLSALYYWLPLGAGLASSLLALGVLICLFVPLMPWMMFVFSVIGWVIAVVEAMVAGPVIALGVTYPEGHELLGRAQQSLALLLSIFVRPVAILFGFIASIGLLYVAYQLINFGFMQVMRSFYTDINDQTFMVFAMSMVGWITMYCYFVITLVTEVFDMIHKIPDMLIRWIGGQPDQSRVRAVVGRIKGAIKEGGSKGSEGLNRAGSSGASIDVKPAGQNVRGGKGRSSGDGSSSAGNS